MKKSIDRYAIIADNESRSGGETLDTLKTGRPGRGKKMFRLVCIDKMDDRREIAIDDNNMATTFYNGKLTGKYSLHSDEVIDIVRAESAGEAFAVLERIED